MELQTDQEKLPAFNGSFEENIAVIFKTVPVVGERYFLPQNSLIDAAIVTGVRPHYHDSAILGKSYDMDSTIQIDGQAYTVLPRADFKNVLLSLATKRNTIKVERLPLSTLEILPNSPAPGANIMPNRARKAFRIAVSSRQCFIEFTKLPVGLRQFVVFISFNYTLRKV